MKNLFAMILAAILPTVSHAFFCPTNFNQIDYGQTPEQVIQQCGKPDSQTTTEDKPEGPQDWTYFIPQVVSNNSSAPMKGTLKVQATFDGEGKSVNITVNGIGVGATNICGKRMQLGDTRDMVKAACGDPVFVNKQTGSSTALGQAPPPNKTIEFTYNTKPPVILKFVNGRLLSKQ